eukprot:TRINITY_DN24455_c0_g1_i2.p1 TRINITY_DN24455_c0_g1~~TRINITY_DN24455_c0_g1_i2.p1  ORF type:complete len:115 (+),score=22.23 TRINITY_DN24455_c0_g1_i2:59-403(+)
MAECFAGLAMVVGLRAKQRHQSGFERLEMCGDGAAGVAESLGSCSTHAPTPAATFLRKRDMIRRWIFGDGTLASESSSASTPPGMRKRDWIRKLVAKKKPDVLEQDALLEERTM